VYFNRHPKKPGLHLIILDKPTISNLYQFGVPEVRRQLLLRLFGREGLQPLLMQTELLLCQMPVYNIQQKSPAVICQKCSFLQECYGYKYLGKLNGSDSYLSQRHCISHSQLEHCPHRDEELVELDRLIPPPEYSCLVQNGNPQETIDIH